MKLQTKATQYYLLFVLPVLAAGGFALYVLLSNEIKDTMDELLWKEKLKIEEQLKNDDTISIHNGRIENELQVTKAPAPATTRYTFSDTMLYDHFEEEVIPFRVLSFTAGGSSGSYHVVLRQSTMESDDLIENIALVIVLLFVLLLAGFILVNFFVTRRLWKPFNATLDQLKQYHPDGKQQLVTVPTSIHEFERLNDALIEMSAKINRDFRNLKEFTQDASHELQTPLAVIRSKLELLLQDSSLPKEKLALVLSCHEACLKLSKLNSSLLLLTKLENNEFSTGAIRLDKIILDQLDNLDEFIGEKNITVRRNIEPVNVECNRMLADIMITNLLSNAIKHNVENGEIIILMDEEKLVIKNTGRPLDIAPAELFGRFKKNDPSSGSLGLGLSIARKIAEMHKMKLDYTVEDKFHIFTLTF